MNDMWRHALKPGCNSLISACVLWLQIFLGQEMGSEARTGLLGAEIEAKAARWEMGLHLLLDCELDLVCFNSVLLHLPAKWSSSVSFQ